MTKKPALGRGLNSLMGGLEKSSKNISDLHEATVTGGLSEISIHDIDPNPENPRKSFAETKLEELTISIKNLGILQAITVRKTPNNRYEIIAGERRFRAAKKAGLKVIPAYIKVATDVEKLEMAVTENIQRENLDPIEIALSYQALMDGLNLTQEELSDKIGKSRSAISHQLRLLKLPVEIQIALQNDQINIGHAKPLSGLKSDENRIKILREILEKDLSVRQVEELCKKIEKNISPKQVKAKSNTSEIIHNELSKKLGSIVKIKNSNKGTGFIKFEFQTEAELNQLISFFLRN